MTQANDVGRGRHRPCWCLVPNDADEAPELYWRRTKHAELFQVADDVARHPASASVTPHGRGFVPLISVRQGMMLGVAYVALDHQAVAS